MKILLSPTFRRFHLVKSLIIILFLFSANSSATELSSNHIADAQNLVKDWTLKSVSGKQVTLSNYQGKPVILVFWATWCPYCKKLLPGIARLNDKYEDKGLKIIAVNIKEDWQPHVYWRNHGYEFDAVLEGDDVAALYGVVGTPSIVFIAPSGEVLKVASFSDPEHPSLEKFAQYYLP